MDARTSVAEALPRSMMISRICRSRRLSEPRPPELYLAFNISSSFASTSALL